MCVRDRAGVDRAVDAVPAAVVRLDESEGCGGGVDQRVLGVDAAVHELDPDVLGRELAERDVGVHPQRGSDLGDVADALRLDVLDTHLGPHGAHVRLPGGEVAGAVLDGGEGAGVGGGRGVEMVDVVADHAGGEHLRAERGPGVAQHLDPAAGHALVVEVVEAGRDLALDEVVQGGGLEVVALVGVVLETVGRRDRPAELRLVPLVPPAVEDRQVEPAVQRRLHAGGAARLVGPQRVVQPHVAAGVERLGERDVVVGQEDDAVAHVLGVGEAHQLLDEPLAAVVGRVGLARHHQLHRALRVQQERLEPLGVAQHQRQPLVRRHPPREADRQHVGVERVVDPAQLGRRRAALLPGPAQPAAGVVDEPRAQRALGVPHLAAGHLAERCPERLVVVAVGVRALRERQGGDLRRHPRGRVHAVGDRGDRHLRLVEGRPQPVEHAAADVAVQLRDAVGALRQPEAHHRHVEDAGVSPVVVLRAERQHLVHRHAGRRAVVAEVLLDQRPREPVDPRRDRRMRREDRRGASRLQGGREVDVAVRGELANPLHPEEAGMALVGVEHLRLRRARDPCVHPQRPHAAHPQQQLLAQPVLGRPAIQPVRDQPVRLGVLLEVGVEQQQRHPAHGRHPDPGQQVRAVGHPDRDRGPRAVRLVQERQRQPVRVEHRVALLLPALPRQGLLEVAVPVQQADAHDRHPEVAGRLQVVAREDAQAAGVLRQHRRDPELRGEVGDRGRPRRLRRRRARPLVPPLLCQVRRQAGPHLRDPPYVVVVGGQLRPAVRGHLAQQPDRVVPHRLPLLGVDLREQLLGRRMPRPAQVGRELPQRGERVGQDGADREPPDRTHGSTVTNPSGSIQGTTATRRA